MRTRAKAILVVVAMLSALFLGVGPAQAATCTGSGCNGKNPSGTSCNADARTVAAMDVQGDGMLELRYSPSCKANWARFTTYWRSSMANSLSDSAIVGARVTVWNPGKRSYGVNKGQVKHGVWSSTWWTAMTNGIPKACTGVELTAQSGSPGRMVNSFEKQGWVWGPCR